MSCFRLCVRDMLCSSEFLLTQALLSAECWDIPTYSSAGSFGELPDGRELLPGEGFHATRNSGTMILIIRRRKMALRSCLVSQHSQPMVIMTLKQKTSNMQYRGVDAGLKALEGSGDPSRDYFQGAAVFLHTDGTGKDHFTGTSIDWRWFSHYWLQAR